MSIRRLHPLCVAAGLGLLLGWLPAWATPPAGGAPADPTASASDATATASDPQAPATGATPALPVTPWAQVPATAAPNTVASVGLAPTSAPSPVTVIVHAAPCPSGAAASQTAPSTEAEAPSLALELELGLGLGTQLAGALVVEDALQGAVGSGGVGTFWSLGAEAAVGRRLWFGGGLTRIEVSDPFSANGERSLTSGEVRARAHLALSPRWALDLVARLGLTHWGDDGLGSLLGWATRLGVGGAYTFAEGFAVTAGISHLRHDSFELDELVTLEGAPRPYPTALTTWLVSVGVRVF